MNICMPTDCFEDPRVLGLKDSQHKKWMALCALAANRKGLIPHYPGAGLARALRTQQHHLAKLLAALEEMELIERDEDGSIWLTPWNYLLPAQVEEEVIAKRSSSAVRMARLRGKAKGRAPAGEPHAAAQKVTPQSVTCDAKSDALKASHVTQKVTPKSVTCDAKSDAPRAHPRKNVSEASLSGKKEFNKFSDSEETFLKRLRIVPESAAPAMRRSDVEAVVQLTGDHDDRGRWVQLWKHCHAASCLHLWDEAQAKLRGKLPPPDNRAAWLDATLRNMLFNAGSPFSGNSAQQEEARLAARASLAGAGKEGQSL